MINGRNILQFTRNIGNLAAAPKTVTKISTKYLSEFKTYYPKLIDRVLNNIKYCEHEEVKQRIKAVAEEYTLIKIPFQGELLLHVYELVEKPENITEKKIQQGYVLGTIQEMVQTYFIILDDVLDHGQTRYKKKCWYLLPGVSKLGINDNSLLRSLTMEMVMQHFDDENLTKILDLTNELYFGTEIAEYLDESIKNLDDFSIDTYSRIENLKSSDYCMVLPLKMALVLCNQANEKSFKIVEDLCFDLGNMIQINNDFTEYMDYRKPFTGKSGTDIKRGICTWLALTALQHFNPEQRKIFKENYGKWDPECEKRIVKLYDEINIENLFYKEREARYKRFLSKAEKLPSHAVPSADVFRQILNFYRSYADDTTKYYFS